MEMNSKINKRRNKKEKVVCVFEEMQRKRDDVNKLGWTNEMERENVRRTRNRLIFQM